jgi:hypothetical protein
MDGIKTDQLQSQGQTQEPDRKESKPTKQKIEEQANSVAPAPIVLENEI